MDRFRRELSVLTWVFMAVSFKMTNDAFPYFTFTPKTKICFYCTTIQVWDKIWFCLNALQNDKKVSEVSEHIAGKSHSVLTDLLDFGYFYSTGQKYGLTFFRFLKLL